MLSTKPLWNHQVQAIRMAEERDCLALFADMGTGKSRMVVEILRRRYAKHGRILRTLILCPIAVCKNWKQEFALYSKVNPADIVVLNQTGAGRIKEMIKWAGDDLGRHKIFVTNYHATNMKDLYALMQRYNFEVIVGDESQKLKNPSGKMAKAVAVLAERARYRYILSGTPILNTPMDIFMQFKILDGGRTFGKNFFSFRAQYCVDKNAGRQNTTGYFPKWEVRPDTYPELQSRISANALRVKKSECLDLPPFIRQEVEVEMSPQQKRMYKEMMNEYIAFIEELEKSDQPRTVTAQIAATKALRLQQIVSGYASIEQTGKFEIFEDVPRMEALEDLLEALHTEHKVIVWAVFKANYQMIKALCTKMGIEYAEIHGEIKDKDAEMNRFRKDPKCRVMIANQAAGGVGINLIEASYCIYYSKNFSLEGDLQSEARNYRGGSEMHQKVTRIDLVARGTIDELVTEALKNKNNIAEQILTWKDKLWTSK